MPFAMALNNKIQLYFHIFFFSFNISSHSVFFFSFECVFFFKSGAQLKNEQRQCFEFTRNRFEFSMYVPHHKTEPLMRQSTTERTKKRERKPNKRTCDACKFKSAFPEISATCVRAFNNTKEMVLQFRTS